jgi:histidine ammonia-lyase
VTEIALDGRTLTPAGVLTLALDSLRGAMAQSASLAAARVSALLDPEVTGLALEPGPDSGAMISNFAGHSARRTSDALSRISVAVSAELVLAVRALRLDPEMADRPLSRDLEAARQSLFEDALWMESEAGP